MPGKPRAQPRQAVTLAEIRDRQKEIEAIRGRLRGLRDQLSKVLELFEAGETPGDRS